MSGGRGLARGLTGELRAVLAALPDEPITAAELAVQLGVTDTGALAGRLSSLRHRGLAAYQRAAGHRQPARWHRTTAGRALVQP